MSNKEGAKRQRVDWEAIEPDWIAGIKSKLQLSNEYGVSRAAMNKHFAELGVERDETARIRAKAEALVTQEVVTSQVTSQTKEATRERIDANAKMLADKVLNQRSDIQRARSIVQKLWEAISTETDAPEEFKRLGEILRSPDQFGSDKLNDAYMYAVSLPQQIKSAKLLADALKTLIELERKVLKIDTMPDPSDAAKAFGEGIAKGMSEASKSFRDDLMAELVGSDE